MKSSITNEQAKAAINETEQEAEKVLKDKKATNEALIKAKDLLESIKKIPVIGSLVDDIVTTIELISDYVKGVYHEVPFRIIVSAMAGIIYLISPIDLIPDIIPMIGYVDDAAVLTMIFSTGVSMELSKYRKWKTKTERERVIKEAREKYMQELN